MDLGPQTAADAFPPESATLPDPRWPLELWLCHRCGIAQLGPVESMPPEVPLAIESATSLAHAATSVRDLVHRRPWMTTSTVAEFVSHHGGSWMRELRAVGARPAADGQRAELVVDLHGLAHEPDLGRALAGRAARLAVGGILVLEFHHLLPLVEGNQFDTIRHGHWSYLSLGAVIRLAEPLGLTAVSATDVPTFGGCLRVVLTRDPAPRIEPNVAATLEREAASGLTDAARLARLRTTADLSATALRELLAELRRDGHTVLGYGAPSRAPVLLDISRIGPELLPFTVDAAPGKHGRRIPGTGVPIRPVAELRAARPDVVLLFVWDIAAEVIERLEADGGWGARYLLPMPAPRFLEPSETAVPIMSAGAVR